ncbi:hypothetical protein [uncultured Draconibacterium sp.]|uniref:hypothetical protein n=1 Tax=uncultured Draconibacterium sp. TaxID=1573823 RepID=UPI0029C99417|nr:hypothetical protein [uncultured Draconibacterium sp.]
MAHSKYGDFLSINGDLNNPELLMISENVGIYNEAVERMNEHLIINNGKLQWDILKGQDINISEEIFIYMTTNYNHLNERIDMNEVMVAFDNNSQLRIILENGVSKKDDIIKLKYVPIPVDELIDLDGLSFSEIIDVLIEFYDLNNGGNLAYHFDLYSVNWNTNGMGDASISGYGTINGTEYSYYMCNACYYQDSYDCWANEIGSSSSTDYADRTHYYIKNIAGLPLITITEYK